MSSVIPFGNQLLDAQRQPNALARLIYDMESHRSCLRFSHVRFVDGPSPERLTLTVRSRQPERQVPILSMESPSPNAYHVRGRLCRDTPPDDQGSFDGAGNLSDISGRVLDIDPHQGWAVAWRNGLGVLGTRQAHFRRCLLCPRRLHYIPCRKGVGCFGQWRIELGHSQASSC